MKYQSLKLPVITEERENYECLRLNNYLPEKLVFPLTYNEINSQFMIPLAEKFEHSISYIPNEKNLRVIVTGRPNSKIIIYREGLQDSLYESVSINKGQETLLIAPALSTGVRH
jgi:hypothetical protein